MLSPAQQQRRDTHMKRVLLTGAAGGVGTRLRKLLPPIYPDLVLSDIRKPDDLAPGERFVQADLADMPAVERLCDGIGHIRIVVTQEMRGESGVVVDEAITIGIVHVRAFAADERDFGLRRAVNRHDASCDVLLILLKKYGGLRVCSHDHFKL